MLYRKNRTVVGTCSRMYGALLLCSLFVGCAAPKRGILVMAHGGDPQWNADVEAVVKPLDDKYPTEIAFGMAQASSIREAVGRLEKRDVREIAVVRMFISGDSFVPATEYILGLRDTPPADPLASRGAPPSGTSPAHSVAAAPQASPELGYAADRGADARADHRGVEHAGDHHAGGDHHGHCREAPEPIPANSKFILSYDGVGDSPLIDEILADRVQALSTDPARESVLFLAHGPADDAENERWLANMNRRVQRLGRLGAFREIRCETLREDWPQRRQEAEKRIRKFVQEAGEQGGRCLVVPFRVAGFGPYKEVLKGLDYLADERGFCPHPNMTRWVEETAMKCFAAP
jgi:sirohydrochlorin ferrochelatase